MVSTASAQLGLRPSLPSYAWRRLFSRETSWSRPKPKSTPKALSEGVRASEPTPPIRSSRAVCVGCSFGPLPLLIPHCHHHITSSFTAIITTEATAPLAHIGPAAVSVSFPRSAPATSRRSESDERANHPGGSDPVGHFRTALAHPAAAARMSQRALAGSRLPVCGGNR